MSLYIPPEGAMQFERTGSVGIIPLSEVPFFWVMPQEQSKGRGECPICGSAMVFPIVVDAIPEPWRGRAIERSRLVGGRVVTCRCRGKIIE